MSFSAGRRESLAITDALARFGAWRLAALVVVLVLVLVLHAIRWPFAVAVWVLTLVMLGVDVVASAHLPMDRGATR
jgi:hypothetical protein